MSWQQILTSKYGYQDVKNIKEDMDKKLYCYDKFYMFFSAVKDGKETIIALENTGSSINLYDFNISRTKPFATE
jgi:hypothetical protein